MLFAFLLFSAMVSQALTNSAPALDPIWDSVVLIRSAGQDPTTSEELPTFCNATLMSPTLLVTAAHCLTQAQILKNFEVEIHQGYYKYGTRPDGTQYRVGYVNRFLDLRRAKFYFLPSLQKKLSSGNLKLSPSPDEDLAVLEIENSVSLTEGFRPFTVITENEFEALRRQPFMGAPKIVTLNYLEQIGTDTRQIASLNSLIWESSGHWKSQSLSRVQAGDSGAPLVAQVGRDMKLIGVVKGRAQTFFSDWDVFASTSKGLCEISKLLGEETKSQLCPKPLMIYE